MPRSALRVRVTAGGVGGMLEARCVDLPLVAVLARSRADVVQRAREAIAVELNVPADARHIAVIARNIGPVVRGFAAR